MTGKLITYTLAALTTNSIALSQTRPAKPVPQVARAQKPSKAQVPITTAARKTKVNPKDGLIYAWIPPGTFMMGCTPEDYVCRSEMKPPREVIISIGFWMGQTEVTQQAYQRITGQNPSWHNNKGDRRPVENLNWHESQSYCQAIGLRLPTEEEWEYAARAGSKKPPSGPVGDIAWYYDNAQGSTAEVGLKRPNAWGLYDMLGNAEEWTSSNYDTRTKVVRGGSASTRYPDDVTLWARHGLTTDAKGSELGFRCVEGAQSEMPPKTPYRAERPSNRIPEGTRSMVNSADGLTYIWINPGTFQMGCSGGDSDCESEPVRQVSIERGFWISQTEFTQGAYTQVTGRDPTSAGDLYPMEDITWFEAEKTCKAVGGRLPTEEEWEYSARAGSKRALYGGNTNVAHYGRGTTERVGTLSSNAWGLYDVLGNVWEWTATTVADGTKVIRGGSFASTEKDIRVSARHWKAPSAHFHDLGFRCVAP